MCRFDRSGAFCETRINIRNAAFGGNSYLSHQIYPATETPLDETNIDDILPMHVELAARTRARDGLILLSVAQGSRGGHYMALFLHNGLLQFQFSCGLQTMLLSELETPVNNGHEFHILAQLSFTSSYPTINRLIEFQHSRPDVTMKSFWKWCYYRFLLLPFPPQFQT